MSRFAELFAAVSRADPGITDALRAAIAEADRPVAVQVAGRAGSGRSTVARALGVEDVDFVTTDAIDGPDPVLDADVVVYVIAERLLDADRAALAMVRPANAIAILNKADAVDGDWAAVIARANESTQITGIQTVPLVGVVADTAESSDIGPDELRALQTLAAVGDSTLTMSPDLFAAADVPVNTRDRLALLNRWELDAVATAVEVLRRDAHCTAATLTQILHASSGIDTAAAVLTDRMQRSAALRGGALLDSLERFAARSPARDDIEQFLRSDAATQIGLAAGLSSPALVDAVAAGEATDRTKRAAYWTHYAASDVGAPARRAAHRVRRGYA